MQYLTLSIDCGTIRVSISSGSISFYSTPSGADIYLIASEGGLPIYTGLQTPNTIPDLPVGNYDYILKLSGFEDYTGIASVNENETTIVTANLIQIRSVKPEIVIAATGASLLGIMLLSTSKHVIPLTTGKLGGEIVTVKL